MSTEQENNSSTSRESEVPRTRSPNFPSMSLRKAVDRTELLYKAAKKYPVSVDSALRTLGFTSTVSSNSAQAIGALRAYGLVTSDGAGAARKIAVSEMGAQIVLNHPDRPKLLQKAALNPPLFSQVWSLQTEDGVPPDDVIRNYLLWELKFNENSIPTFIASFRETLAYAGLERADKIPGDADSEAAASTKAKPNGETPFSPRAIKVGDLVQWQSGGVLRLPTPQRVVGFHENEWAYLEGSLTGVPVNELVLVEESLSERAVPAMATKSPPSNPFFRPTEKHPEETGSLGALKAGVAEEKMTLDEGPVLIRWPNGLSKDSVDELEYFLKGLIKRARRKAGMTSSGSGAEEDSDH